MNILVCIKRVPAPGSRIVISANGQRIVTTNLGFTVSPHEECALEEALRLKELHGGVVTVLTLGSVQALEQLRHALAMGADEAVLLATEDDDWDPQATARAISDAIGDRPFDLLLFGNESADAGGYQVGIRVAHALGMPCITGIKGLELKGQRLTAQRESSEGVEIYQFDLPALVAVKEGINLPRYPSLPGRMRANRAKIEQLDVVRTAGGPRKIRLVRPEEQESSVQILGNDITAVPKVVEILQELNLLTQE